MSHYLEIGPGRGDFLFWLAKENLTSQIYGVEYKKKRFDKLVNRLEKNGLLNIFLHSGDARTVLPQEFSDGYFQKIFILFSDPWPKRRHQKHRLFQESFIRELWRVLEPGGQIFIAHDDPNYLQEIRQLFELFSEAFSYSSEGVQFMTFYAEKWIKEGRQLKSFSYRKKPNAILEKGCHLKRDYLALPCVLPAIEDS